MRPDFLRRATNLTVAERNGIVEIAGPERAPFNEIVARYLNASTCKSGPVTG
jgi:hypothetical protein